MSRTEDIPNALNPASLKEQCWPIIQVVGETIAPLFKRYRGDGNFKFVWVNSNIMHPGAGKLKCDSFREIPKVNVSGIPSYFFQIRGHKENSKGGSGMLSSAKKGAFLLRESAGISHEKGLFSLDGNHQYGHIGKRTRTDATWLKM